MQLWEAGAHMRHSSTCVSSSRKHLVTVPSTDCPPAPGRGKSALGGGMKGPIFTPKGTNQAPIAFQALRFQGPQD